MSHKQVKIKYNSEGPYGTIEQRTLYADHNNSCDIVTFYDDDGSVLFRVNDTIDNNMFDAIVALYTLKEGIEILTDEDRIKCDI